ncbi:MAG: hypothetical protein R2748_19375 [Bryobacterales bacterium]
MLQNRTPPGNRSHSAKPGRNRRTTSLRPVLASSQPVSIASARRAWPSSSGQYGGKRQRISLVAVRPARRLYACVIQECAIEPLSDRIRTVRQQLAHSAQPFSDQSIRKGREPLGARELLRLTRGDAQLRSHARWVFEEARAQRRIDEQPRNGRLDAG